jgi:hypothetical protein
MSSKWACVPGSVADLLAAPAGMAEPTIRPSAVAALVLMRPLPGVWGRGLQGDRELPRPSLFYTALRCEVSALSGYFRTAATARAPTAVQTDVTSNY